MPYHTMYVNNEDLTLLFFYYFYFFHSLKPHITLAAVC